VKNWEYFFIAGFCASGVLWSSTAFLPYSGDIVVSLLFVVLVQVGISSVIVSMYSSSKNMVLLYLAITLLPPLLRLFMIGDSALMLVGIIGLVFLLILKRAVVQQSQNLIEFISLKIQNDEFSKKDILTGLWNRRQLYDVVEKLVPRCVRHNEIFSIIMMDIDFFKKYNDTRGHAAGDQLLKNISRLIQGAIREEDVAVRYGGEEFLLILSLASTREAYEIGERIRQVVKEKTDVTISGGVATFGAGKTFDEMTLEADKLLYKAKESGRDMICC
jgi:diguanylate cyclase